MARASGVEIDEISPSEIASRYPGLNVEDSKGGVYLVKDGQADPVNITQALAKGARAKGAKIIEGVKVTSIHKKDIAKGPVVTGVSTDQGDITADYVVNCGGMWAREIGQMAGVTVPLHACEHFYIVTEQIDGLQRNLPVLRVPDECAYYKEDAGKLLLGAFEPVAKPWGGDGISDDFEFTTLPDDFDHFMPILKPQPRVCPCWRQPAFRLFSTGRKALPLMIAIFWAKPRSWGISLSQPALIRSAFSRRAVPVWRWPTGWIQAARRWISGMWISGGCTRSRQTVIICLPG